MRVLFIAVFLLSGLTTSFGQTSVQVIAEKANIRISPSAKAAVVATVTQEESLELIESRGAWFKVRTSDRAGWIHGNAVRTINPALVLPPRYGDPNSRFGDLSNGPGSGSGIGTGRGQGSGTGTGGQGRGAGSGTGAGTVAVDDRSRADEPANAPLRFLHMSRPGYTEIARNKGIQGTVRLKVTFLASGQIGAIVPITGLPDGLTDKAIEAAKLIKFRPQRVNGVPRTVVKPVEYSFTVY